VLLFCRIEGYPYVFCGHAGLVRCDPGASPLRFDLELLDFAQMTLSNVSRTNLAALAGHKS